MDEQKIVRDLRKIASDLDRAEGTWSFARSAGLVPSVRGSATEHR